MAKKEEEKAEVYLSTGLTLLDLVVGGGEGMGFPAGKIINIVGDKSSGKTFVSIEMIAKNYHGLKIPFKWNYDDGESGFTFNTSKLYGVEVMHKDTLSSKTIEDLDVNAGAFLATLKPKEVGIYVIDSLDGLGDEEKFVREAKRAKAHSDGKAFTDGTYGIATPKFLSQEFFKTKTSQFSEKKALLVFVSQTRENLDPFTRKKATRSGGKALDFYCHTVLWLANVAKIKKGDRVVGVVVEAKAEKSKTPRPYRSCRFSLYFDYGLDNIGSNLDYLYDIRGKDGQLVGASKNIIWQGEPATLDNVKTFLEDQGMVDEVRKAKKEATGTGNLSLSFMKEWIESFGKALEEAGATKEAAAFLGAYKEKFGDPISRGDLIDIIEADPKMEKELERRVIAKWEEIEGASVTQRKRKYK